MIKVLRSKGLTDEAIEEIIHQREARKLREAYIKGFKEGVQSTLKNLLEVTVYVNATDKELA